MLKDGDTFEFDGEMITLYVHPTIGPKTRFGAACASSYLWVYDRDDVSAWWGSELTGARDALRTLKFQDAPTQAFIPWLEALLAAPATAYPGDVPLPPVPIKHDAQKPRMDLIPWEVAGPLQCATNRGMQLDLACDAITDALACAFHPRWGGHLGRALERLASAGATLEGVAKVLTIGAQKYGDVNWQILPGLGGRRTLAAALRHIVAVTERGEANDPETGLLHVDHAACEVLFAAYYATHKDEGYTW